MKYNILYCCFTKYLIVGGKLTVANKLITMIHPFYMMYLIVFVFCFLFFPLINNNPRFMEWILEYLCHRWRLICFVCRSQNPVFLYSFITYQRILAKVTRQLSQVEQELLTLPEHMSSLPVLMSSCSLVFCVVFCGSLFVFLFFFF